MASTQRFQRATVTVPQNARLTVTFHGEEPGDFTEQAAFLLHLGAESPASGDNGDNTKDVGVIESDSSIRWYLDGKRISNHAALEHVAAGVVHVIRAAVADVKDRIEQATPAGV